MASLRFREKNLLEDFLEMGGGYVLNFSDRTFADFFRDFDVEIDGAPYLDGHSGSKANRMRSFWDSAPDRQVGEVLQELIEYAESYRPGHPGANACRAIATRLQARQPPPATPQPASVLAQQRSIRLPITERPIEIFFSYAHEDEALMDMILLQLVVRERIGEIVKWHDRMIPAGDEWRTQIDGRIERAHVILLFMSPHFLASRYCYEIEGEIALRRHREGTARVIPVVLRACDWTVTPFGKLRGLPIDGIPITQWADRDQASLEVARGTMDSIL
ncbi:MAG: toll/interleukin-1 receptor domain-containing protein [Deltaproteobacteria bacterium]|nr:toll/interleukin-1 receptor domain-containing protein [Deltaproteobacteria bacterium]